MRPSPGSRPCPAPGQAPASPPVPAQDPVPARGQAPARGPAPVPDQAPGPASAPGPAPDPLSARHLAPGRVARQGHDALPASVMSGWRWLRTRRSASGTSAGSRASTRCSPPLTGSWSACCRSRRRSRRSPRCCSWIGCGSSSASPPRGRTCTCALPASRAPGKPRWRCRWVICCTGSATWKRVMWCTPCVMTWSGSSSGIPHRRPNASSKKPLAVCFSLTRRTTFIAPRTPRITARNASTS